MAEPTALPQTFHVDAPETAPSPTPGNSPVPADVHDQLADALGVPVEAVTVGPGPGEAPALAPSLSDDIDDAPSSGKTVAEILAERATYRDPTTFTKPEPMPDADGPIDDRTPAELAAMSLSYARRPVKDGWWENGDGKLDAPMTPRAGDTFTFTPSGVVHERDPNPGYTEKMDDLFNKVEGVMAGENPGPQPGPGPFAARAEISQRIKRCLKVENVGLPDAEIEGFHMLAQMVAKILVSANGDQRLIWMELAKHCDDVAAALRS